MILESLVKEFEKTKSHRAVRVFHGPGIHPVREELHNLAIDRFNDHYWVHYWASESHQTLSDGLRTLLIQFFRMIKAESAVLSIRPFRGSPEPPSLLKGLEMPAPFVVEEHTGVKVEIHFKDMRHPGLFLDHSPLREWLVHNSKGKTVLNTFSYTGSLSVAAALGGAKQVTTLDLSKVTLEWAKRNAEINGFEKIMNEYYAQDFFEFQKRWSKSNKKWDIVILDPPSFSRSKNGTFSTKKDLLKLHFAALGLLAQDGVLITSINSENITREFYFDEISETARQADAEIRILGEIHQPDSFPVNAKMPETAYLKGWILKVKFLGRKK
ncbi:MAG: class I SAM-dependent rRNA methyltransferase [Xanthomonadaceae bacterium]|nr:class I SAM-dependent rRNA methyltransferase [Xanthomonadaceae bacterium]